jgi:hypothetical protein
MMNHVEDGASILQGRFRNRERIEHG